jgi:hypothetical protein
MTKSSFTALFVAAASLAGARVAQARQDQQTYPEQAYEYAQVPGAPPQAPPPQPVPPSVEEAPAAAPQGGGYCYGGPHPVDTRVAPGPAWDEWQGTHIHPYPPFDLRLFVLRSGCYHFVGDPTDFGYRGTTYRYYGAHPVHEHHGGGWCFMIAGHSHWWRPWSAYFTLAGPWYYWYGGYDPFFWSYWPYYASYYRNYYPRYYGGGRFYRGGRRDRLVAPPIGRSYAPPARGMAASGTGTFATGRPPASVGGSPAPAPARGSWNRALGWPSHSNGWSQGAPSSGVNDAARGDVPSVGWATHPSGRSRAVAPAPAPAPGSSSGANRGGWNRLPERTFVSPARPTWEGDASGWSGSFRTAPAQSAPAFRGSPAPARSMPSASPSFRNFSPPSAPARGFPSSSGGGFRSGGGSSRGGWRR